MRLEEEEKEEEEKEEEKEKVEEEEKEKEEEELLNSPFIEITKVQPSTDNQKQKYLNNRTCYNKIVYTILSSSIC